jgi:hypothetical protein
MPVPSRIADRITAGIKRFQPILTAAKARDVNESDTSIIITDMLADVFGYDKYTEVTSEFAIRGTFCDLAIKQEGKIRLLIEVKAIGSDVRDSYIKQAVDYAANQGVEWVLLTTGVVWQVYRVSFTQPITQDLVCTFDFLTLNPKDEATLETLFMISKEGMTKSLLDDYHTQRQAMSRFFLGAMVLSDPVIEIIRRELRRVSPGVRLEIDQIRKALAEEVIKREVVEGDKAEEARRKISRTQNRLIRKPRGEGNGESEVAPAASAAPESTPETSQTID